MSAAAGTARAEVVRLRAEHATLLDAARHDPGLDPLDVARAATAVDLALTRLASAEAAEAAEQAEAGRRRADEILDGVWPSLDAATEAIRSALTALDDAAQRAHGAILARRQLVHEQIARVNTTATPATTPRLRNSPGAPVAVDGRTIQNLTTESVVGVVRSVAPLIAESQPLRALGQELSTIARTAHGLPNTPQTPPKEIA